MFLILSEILEKKFKNSKNQAIKVGLEFLDNIRNNQRNNYEMESSCPQISSNATTQFFFCIS